MFGKIICILLCIWAFSCKNKRTENKDYSEDIATHTESELNPDSMSYIMWVTKIGLVSESKIPRIKKLNDIEEKLELSTSRIRDSIVNTVDTSKLALIGSTEYLDILKKAMKDGDEESYYILRHDNQISVPYNLYIAEKYGFALAYSQTYEFILTMNMSKLRESKPEFEKKDIYNLDYLSNDKKDLALYTLIKGFKKGDIYNAKRISLYFKEGLYFPKDKEIANELDSLYEEYKKTGLRN